MAAAVHRQFPPQQRVAEKGEPEMQRIAAVNAAKATGKVRQLLDQELLLELLRLRGAKIPRLSLSIIPEVAIL